MLKKQTTYCAVCGDAVCEGDLSKTVLKPYCVILPYYECFILLDAFGITNTNKGLNEENPVCLDCYNKLITKPKEVRNAEAAD